MENLLNEIWHSSVLDIHDIQAIHLQLNIDGLPLSKCKKCTAVANSRQTIYPFISISFPWELTAENVHAHLQNLVDEILF